MLMKSGLCSKASLVMIAAMACFMASPAYAAPADAARADASCPCWPLAESGAIPVDLPEPTEYTLFAIGVAGLLIGRHLSRKRRTRDK